MLTVHFLDTDEYTPHASASCRPKSTETAG
jgi:hypothetical protein